MYLRAAVKSEQLTSFSKSEFPYNILLMDISNPRSLIMFNIAFL